MAITTGILGYVSRDWDAARDAKDAYWAERVARLGPEEGLRIADELRRQILRQDPHWPTEDDRLAHLRLSELLRRAGSARRG